MVRRLLQTTQVVIHTRILDPRHQAGRRHDHVNAQPTLGLILEPAAAVVEPAETVADLRVQVAKAVDQAKRTVEALIASMELFVQSMDNLNQVATRVNRLLDDIEGPVRQIAPHINGALSATTKLADISGALNELTKRLGPLLSFLPQTGTNKNPTSEN